MYTEKCARRDIAIIILYNLHVRDEFDWPNSDDAIRLRYTHCWVNRERIITREVTASQLAASFQVIALVSVGYSTRRFRLIPYYTSINFAPFIYARLPFMARRERFKKERWTELDTYRKYMFGKNKTFFFFFLAAPVKFIDRSVNRLWQRCERFIYSG